jgi:hypothetical protein
VSDPYFERPGLAPLRGSRVQQPGTGGAWLMADHRDQKTGAGR